MGFVLGVPAADGMIDFLGNASLRSDASQFEAPNPFLDQDGFVLVDASIVYRIADVRKALIEVDDVDALLTGSLTQSEIEDARYERMLQLELFGGF